MKPAYRPGLVPQVAMKPRMGARSRMHTMQDLMGECPSLLDDLVFYSMWMGSQCVDMISGTVLTNSASPILPTYNAPNGELAGNYIAASSQFLTTPSTTALAFGDCQFTISSWMQRRTAVYQTYVAKWVAANSEYILYYENSANRVRFEVQKTNNSGSVGINASSAGALPLSTAWKCVFGFHDSINDILGVCVDGRMDIVAHSLGVRASNCAFTIGAEADASLPQNGPIGPVAAWRRILPLQEMQAYDNNGIGIAYPF